MNWIVALLYRLFQSAGSPPVSRSLPRRRPGLHWETPTVEKVGR